MLYAVRPPLYNPLYTPTSLALPRDRKAVYAWARHFYLTEPYVGAAIDIYASLSINEWKLETPIGEVQDFFEELFDDLHLADHLHNIALEYWKIGDVFILTSLGEDYKWDNITILNPDYIDVQFDPISQTEIVEFTPDWQLITMVRSKEPQPIYMRLKRLAPEVLEAIEKGQRLVIPPLFITHLKSQSSPYAIWGVPLVFREFKVLMYREMLRRAQFSIARYFALPVKVWYVGAPTRDTNSPPIRPSQQEINKLAMELSLVESDPKYGMITYHNVEAKFVGASGQIHNLQHEYDFMEREMLVGMGITRAALYGEGHGYTPASIGGRTFLKKLQMFRRKVERFVNEKLIEPLCILQGFYRYDPEKDEVVLVKPRFTFQPLKLEESIDRLRIMQELYDKKLISGETLLDYMQIDYQTEHEKIRKEQEERIKMEMELQQQFLPEPTEDMREIYEKPLEVLEEMYKNVRRLQDRIIEQYERIIDLMSRKPIQKFVEKKEVHETEKKK